jgi:ectoine hydroxylase-related dioxygenase (phytanoyl-CoA dioxygenase family)
MTLRERFERDGVAFPMRAISEEQAHDWLERFEFYEAMLGLKGPPRPAVLRLKAHLCFTFMFDLICNKRILDEIEQLVGPDILCVTSVIWVKNPRDGMIATWHQDSAYAGFDPGEGHLTWTAITPSTRDNGCVRFVPGTHREPLRQHDETFAADNMLSRGQVIRDVDEARAISAELAPGQFSIHHERTIHGSDANASDQRRIGFSGVYVPTSARSATGRRSALLVRGEDRYGHWDPEPVPRFDLDPVCVAFCAEANDKYLALNQRNAATV